jgi:hypothetical protein
MMCTEDKIRVNDESCRRRDVLTASSRVSGRYDNRFYEKAMLPCTCSGGRSELASSME